jgi:hypothetical protein
MSSTTNPAALKRVDTPRPDWLETTGASIYQMTALNSMDPNAAIGKRKRMAAKKRSNKKLAPQNRKILAFEIDLLATIPGESLMTDLGIERGIMGMLVRRQLVLRRWGEKAGPACMCT